MRLALLLVACLLAAFPVRAQEHTLTIALAADVNTLDPDMTGSVGTDLSVISHLYVPLVIRGADMKLAPALAQSWRQVDDHTWRFSLVPGAHFADGEKLDAAAVKWNFDRVRDPKLNARIKAWFDPVSDVRVIGDTELEIVTSQPYPALADQLSMFFLLPPQWTATHNPAHEAMSGGPYTLAAFVPGDHITLKANPDYWGTKPAFSTVTFRIIPEAASRVASLLTGEIDLTTGIPVDAIRQIQKSGRATAGAVPSTRSLFIKMNTEIPPLKDNTVLRQALNYAIDKQGLDDGIFDGLAPVSQCQVLTPAYTGYNPALKPYPYDPAKARAMIQAAHAQGTTLVMEVPTAVYLQGEDTAQAVAAQLEDVGIHVKIQEMQFGAWMNKYVRAHDLGQLAYLTQAWPTLDADGLLTLFAPGNPYAYWNDKDFGDLLDRARITTDRAARDALYAQATARMCEQAPIIFLLTQPATFGVGPKVVWHARGDDWVRAMDVTPK